MFHWTLSNELRPLQAPVEPHSHTPFFIESPCQRNGIHAGIRQCPRSMGTGANVPLLPLLLLMLTRVLTSVNDARQHVSKCFNVLQYDSTCFNMLQSLKIRLLLLLLLLPFFSFF